MATAKAPKYLVVVLTAVAIALAGLTAAVVTVNQSASSSKIATAGPNVGVYSNGACTNSITSINWGSIEAGSSASQIIYVKDTGDAAMALSLSVNNWNSSTASTYITLTWTGQGAQISAGGSLAVTLTLTVSSSTPTSIRSFSNTITVSGTG